MFIPHALCAAGGVALASVVGSLGKKGAVHNGAVKVTAAGMRAAEDLSQRLQRRIEARYHLIVGLNTALIALGVASLIPLTTAATLHNLSTVAIAASNTRPLLSKI